VFSRTQAARSSANPVAAHQELIASRLLPMLFEGIEERDRLVVLDVGCGAQSTVNFFGQYNTHIHFVDLFSNPLLVNPPEEIDAESACRSFSEYLSLSADVTFDVCLFWDVLHRIDLPVLRGLSQALHPHLHRNTQGYAFGTLHGSTLDHRRYGICDIDHLSARATEATGRFFAHTQKQSSDHFASFDILRATLLRTGRLELLLGAD
jgi:hypothetical protein